MKYWLTQSLLSDYIYWRDSEDAWAEPARQSFLATLKREHKEPTPAMLTGRAFEADINALAAGLAAEPNPKWAAAAHRFARICAGGQPQTPLTGELTVGGMTFVLYGVADYVKAGQIIDIKRPTRYEYGKYYSSPQHPMYLHLLPEATKFTYLIYDGSWCHREVYRRADCIPIERTISEFIQHLTTNGLLQIYTTHWAMNPKREELTYGIYCSRK